MVGGRLFLVEKIIYELFKSFKLKQIFYKQYVEQLIYLPILIFFEVIYTCKPLLGAIIWKFKPKGKKIRKKGKLKINTKVIPVNIRRESSYFTAVGWLVNTIKADKNKKLTDSVVQEFQLVLHSKGGNTLKKKQQLYKLITLNREFAHFRW